LTGTAAAQGKKVEAAPIPTQITIGKRAFIANGGGDVRWNDDPLFSRGVDRSYNQFYAGMKGAGRYELVSAPADADLIFEIELLVPTAEPQAASRLELTAVPFDPQFRLTIRDPKTNVLLWGFTEHVQWAILRGNRDKNFDDAMTRVLADVQGLASRAQIDATGGRSQ
jgi:hypothetical protein